jgi:hypothetical protein
MSVKSIVSLLLPAFLSLTGACLQKQALAGSLPRQQLVLWAWERPEDLRFINPEYAAVAFLAKTILISQQGMSVKPRLQPLAVPAHTELIAVVRIESKGLPAGPEREELLRNIVGELINTCNSNDAPHLQIDFDARLSERKFYCSLLKALRRELPNKAFLSITALTSWCLHDRWIKDIPVDDAIPMIFRMGDDAKTVREFLERGGEFNLQVCSKSLGVSIDELPKRMPAGKRIYAFSPRLWSKEDYQRILKEMESWQK